uniref:Uncharacterized protein n=1 Tax=Glossina austeni TaxID=7395 RepID=A0A1A9VY61_GLOAU
MGLTPTLQRSPPNIPVPHKLSPIAIFVIFAPNGGKPLGSTFSVHGKVGKCRKINSVISYLQDRSGRSKDEKGPRSCPASYLKIYPGNISSVENVKTFKNPPRNG